METQYATQFLLVLLSIIFDVYKFYSILSEKAKETHVVHIKLVRRYRSVVITMIKGNSSVSEAILGNFCKAGILLKWFKMPPEAGSQLITGYPMTSIIFFFLILMLAFWESDQDVNHIYIILTIPFSLWFKTCLAIPPSYILVYLLLWGRANIINLYL